MGVCYFLFTSLLINILQKRVAKENIFCNNVIYIWKTLLVTKKL